MNIVILSYLTLSTGLLYHGPKRHGGDRPEEGEAIHRSRSKVMTAAEAVARFVRPGSTLGMGGQNVGRCPMALTHEIIRQRIGDLTVVGCNLSIAMDQLVGAGLVRRTVCGSGNLERFGTTLCWRRAVEEGAVEVVDYSHLAMVTRFLAGEMGVPFMPTRSLLGSDLLRPPAAPGPAPGPPPPDRPVVFGDPWHPGTPVVLVPALQPDTSLLHVPLLRLRCGPRGRIPGGCAGRPGRGPGVPGGLRLGMPELRRVPAAGRGAGASRGPPPDDAGARLARWRRRGERGRCVATRAEWGYSRQELMVIESARHIRDGEVVFVGR